MRTNRTGGKCPILQNKILIAGGFGFIGSHIANALSESTPNNITVYDINAHEGKKGNTVVCQGDIFDSEKLVKVMQTEEISTVIDMIGLASIPSCEQKPEASFRLNVASVQAVLEAMRQSNAERLIFPSTAAIYGATNGPQVSEKAEPKPSTTYGSHKLAAEKLIRDYAQKYSLHPTILRLFNVYGDLEKEQGVISLFVRKAIAGQPVQIRGGNQLRDFVFLKDVVSAFANAVNTSKGINETINVGSGTGVSINGIAEMVTQHFPQLQINHEASNGGEYSIYADISVMKNNWKFTPIPPSKGIPAFIKECRLKCK